MCTPRQESRQPGEVVWNKRFRHRQRPAKVAKADEPMMDATKQPKSKGQLVLVVDDDPAIRNLLTEVLRDSGYQVEEAPNGARAFAAIANHRPDLILLDLMMPVMNGWEFCQRLRSRPAGRRLPVIVISANQRIQRDATEAGATDFLPKPFGLDELLDKVSLYLRKPFGKLQATAS